jgi:DNA-binding beta-propeller fold protein YncE
MFKLAFFVLAIVTPATAQLLAPSATRAPYTDRAIPGDGPDTLEQGMVPQAANQVTDQSEQVPKGAPSPKGRDLPDYGQQTKRILYIVPNFNAISAGAHLPPQTAHDKFLEPGTGPGQFNTPHSIATDDAGNVYVADRGNDRIQVFDGDGKFQREIHINVPYDHKVRPWMGNMPSEMPATSEAPAPLNKTMLNGSPWAICITPGPHQVLYASDGYPRSVYRF